MKFDNICKHFRTNLHKLLQAKKYCDIILISGDGTRIPAHRLILETSSQYFADQFSDVNINNDAKEVVVAKIDGIILQRLVDACYSGTLKMDQYMYHIYIGAVHLQLNGLLYEMENYVIEYLDFSNCVHFYHFSQNLSRSMLFEASKNYICKHFVKITQQPYFLKLNTKMLKTLLALEGLQVLPAEDIFLYIMKWIQHNRDRQVLYELLPHLRLSSMSPKFLIDNVAPHCNTVEAKDLILATLQTQLKSNPLKPTNVEQTKLIVVYECDQKCEIIEYSTEQRMWITLAKLPTKVKYLSVTHSKALNSLCFIGGFLEGSHVSDVLLWNLKTRIFSKLKNMKRPRRFPGVISLNDDSDENGDLIVVGGWNGTSLSTVERWSRKLGEWHSLLPTKEIRSGTRLAKVGNLMYCIGGLGKTRLKSVECYDLSKKYSYTSRAPVQHARQACGICVDGRKIYVIGGYTNVIECYDSDANKWTEVCSVEDSEEVKVVVRHNNGLFAFAKNIILTSDGDWKTWKRPLNIEAVDGYIYGAFSIPPQ